MVVLHIYGKISPICISKKLGLYISNLPEEEDNNWKEDLEQELQYMETIDELDRARLGISMKSQITELYKKLNPVSERSVCIAEMAHAIADKMICMYFNYEYDDMPLGGWETNCFDGRFCEEDYAEKIVDLMTFLSYHTDEVSFPAAVQWVYSSNHDEINHSRIFWGGVEATEYIEGLKKWGKLFDAFLQSENDYYLFDFICNAIHKDNDYNVYHLLKSYSLCQLFLENEHENELDKKLPEFLDGSYSIEERERMALSFRQVRNKIAHGDFIEFNKKIEEYTKQFMDGHFDFDYSEYSRQNWAISNICCALDDALRKIIYLLFTDRNRLEQIKKR
ncbi:MAG: hypothetical protein IKN04_22220 [Clostridia bacterium]|nr:hypothetical protein [Clostridia bacterium]